MPAGLTFDGGGVIRNSFFWRAASISLSDMAIGRTFAVRKAAILKLDYNIDRLELNIEV